MASYVRAIKNVLLARRDHARLAKRGWVATDDYVEQNVAVVYRIDADLKSRPVGLVTDAKHTKHVIKRVETGYSRRNTLVRVKDLMDIKQISFRTGRAKATIVGTWLRWSDFPDHIAEFGGSKVWFWPDVLECMERHGLTVVREKEVADGNESETEVETPARPA